MPHVSDHQLFRPVTAPARHGALATPTPHSPAQLSDFDVPDLPLPPEPKRDFTDIVPGGQFRPRNATSRPPSKKRQAAKTNSLMPTLSIRNHHVSPAQVWADLSRPPSKGDPLGNLGEQANG